MTRLDWTDEQRQFEARVAARSVEPAEIFSDRGGTVVIATSVLDALDGEFELGPHLMLVLGLQRSGRFLREGDWGRAEGAFRPGTCAIALPHTRAQGYSPEVRLLGLALSPQRAQAALAEHGGIDALLPAANALHADPLVVAVMTALWRDAQAHGLTTAFFDHGIDLVLRRLSAFDRPAPQTLSIRSLSARELQKAQELIESRIGSDLRVEDIARALNRDVRSLTRAFRAATGYAPFEYLTFRRMERAKELLLSDRTVMEIALAVGYANPAKFAAAFRRLCDHAPSEWRALNMAGPHRPPRA